MGYEFISAAEAAEMICNGNTLGLSGFTAPGNPKSITEALAAELKHEISRYQEQVVPAIIQIPGVSGNTGAGITGVKKSVEQAVGSDILFGSD